MGLRSISLPWLSQPQEYCEVNSDRWPGLDVWLPTSSGLVAVSASAGATFSSAQGDVGVGRAGRDIRKLSANYLPALSFTPRAGATYEFWLAVLGGNIPAAGVTSLSSIGNSTANGVIITGDRVMLRAANNFLIINMRSPEPGDAVAWQNRNGDHRLYFRGLKNVVTENWGTCNAGDGVAIQRVSFSMLARWTDFTPTDSDIWELLDIPWGVFAPQQIWVPTPGATIPADALWLTSQGNLVRAGAAGSNGRMYLMPDGSRSVSTAAVPGGRALRMLADGSLLG